MMFQIKGRYVYLIIAMVMAVALILPSIYIFRSEERTADISALTFYTEEFPPYNYQENGTLKGIAVDLLGEITEKMGNEIEPNQIHLAPWTEGYQAALGSKNTVLFSTFRLPEREDSFKWVGPITTDRYVLFAGWGHPIVVNGLDDLKQYKIGVITDDAAISQLLDIGLNTSQLVYDVNVSVLVEKLVSGDIDLWCYPETVGRFMTQLTTGNYYSFNVAYALDDIESYYAFSKDVPDPTIRSFQNALDALKLEKDAAGVSKYDRTLGQYIPSIGLANLNYLTEEWAPFNYEKNGTPAGLSVEILEAVFRYLGVNRTRADVDIVPLADAFQQAQDNTSTVLFSIVRTPERDPFYKWAGPFTKSSFVLYAPLDKHISIDSQDDLKKYKIGAVTSTIENDLLVGQGVNASDIVNGQDPSELLQMLAAGEIDIWATGDLTGRYEMEKAGLDPEDYEIVHILSENDFYFVFSKDVPDMLVSSFQHGLEFLRTHYDAHGISEYSRIIYRYLGVGYAQQTFTNEAVMALVNTTAAAIEEDASDTFHHINAGDAPYKTAENPGLYVFVYDTNVTIVSYGDNPLLIGVNFAGKTDVTGKAFRDDIVAGALSNGTGWVEYVYINPTQSNLYYKITYYQLVMGSDGERYIVCSGNFQSFG